MSAGRHNSGFFNRNVRLPVTGVTNSNTVVMIDIPSIPSKVDASKLNAYGSFLSKKDSYLMATNSKLEEDGVHAQNVTNIPYDVLSFEGSKGIICETLGSGNHGSVSLVQADGQYYASKFLRSENEATREHRILKKIGQTPTQSPIPKKKNEQDKSKIEYVVVMDYVNGISADQLKELEIDYAVSNSESYPHPLIPPVLRLHLAIEILKELHKLHEHGIAHRDLAMGNVMLDFIRQKVKLVDYGLAVELGPDGTFVDKIKGSTIGYPAEIRVKLQKGFEAYLNDRSSYQDPLVTYSALTDSNSGAILLADFFYLLEMPESNAQSMEENMKEIIQWEDRSYIAPDENDILFIENDSLPKAELKEVLTILHEMTTGFPYDPLTISDEIKKRLVLEKAIAKLEVLEKQLIQKGACIKVAMLNIDAFFQADKSEQQILIAALQKDFHEVWFTDTQARTRMEYAQLQSKFEQMSNMRSGNKVFAGDTVEAEKALTDYLKNRPIPSDCQSVQVKPTLTQTAKPSQP